MNTVLMWSKEKKKLNRYPVLSANITTVILMKWNWALVTKDNSTLSTCHRSFYGSTAISGM